MIKLLMKHDKLIQIFSESTYNTDILQWVNTKLIEGAGLFSLNEEYSCDARLFGTNIIQISGDEDSCDLYIENTKVIEL